MKTMKHTIAKYFAAAAALCLTAVGCSTLQEDKGVSENRDIRFSASIGSFQVKATDTAFENGDAIGLYAGDHVKAENVRLDWKDGALTPETPVQWGFNQLVDESTLFSAYYPYTAEPQIATDEGELYLAFSVQKDQSTHAAYTASDLMTASTYATPAEGTVNFTFIHRLSKLVLTVDNRLNDPVKEVYVGNVYTDGLFDIVHTQDYGRNGEPSSIKACEGVTAEGTKAWSVIIPSQSCQITLTLVTESGKEYTYKAESYVYFAAARRYTAQVILDETAISTSFSATVYDWIDNGGFWFKQPNPLYNGQWSIVGTIYGTNWDKDFYLWNSGDALYTDVVLHAGDEFKFRRDGDWEVNFGAADITSVGGDYSANYGISRGGANFVVEKDGLYYITVNLNDNVLYMWREGDLPTPEGTSIWTGKAYMNNWESADGFATKDVWVNNDLQEGDEIRIYYDGGRFDGKEYWAFQVYDSNWRNGYNYDSGGYNYWTGYVSLYVDWEWYNALTSQDSGNDAGLYIMGENVTITAITLVKPYRPAEGEWTIIGTIYGSSWDRDFQMTDQSAAGSPGCWSAVLDYINGEEFKFRQSGTWDVNLGFETEGGLTDNGNNSYSATLVQNGPNIMLPMEGVWELMLNTVDNTLSATYIGK